MKIFNSPDPMQRAYWYIAIISSLIALIKLIAYYFKYRPINNFESYFHFSDTVVKPQRKKKIISFNNLINFMIVLGWSGLLASVYMPDRATVLFIPLIAGFVGIYLNYSIRRKN